MDENAKVTALIENYKLVSEESKSYLTEMLRCFPYTAIILAIAFGFGGLSGLNDSFNFQELRKYMPLALLGLVIYFFSLGFMYVNACRYKAEIESKINSLASDKIFGFELDYKPDLLKSGFLPWHGKRILPVPNLLLGIMMLGIFLFLVFDRENWFLYAAIGVLFALMALYVFLFIPRVIEKYQRSEKRIEGVSRELHKTG